MGVAAAAGRGRAGGQSFPRVVLAIRKGVRSKIKMVEAAGIEPASENRSYETTTCVVSLCYGFLVLTSSD